jgi:biotin carboxyl carrier protein
MKLEVEIGGSKHEIEINQDGEQFRLETEGRTVEGNVLRPEPGVYTFFVGDRVVEAHVSGLAGSDAYRVEVGGRTHELRIVDRKHRAAGGDVSVEGRQALAAPMPGKVVALLVAVGDAVEQGQGVLVVEAMKMQNEVKTPKAGTVAELRVAPGEAVTAGQVLAVID